MKISATALSTLFICPVVVQGFSLIPYSHPLLASMLDVETPFELMRKRRRQSLERLFKEPSYTKRSSPAYEITNSDTTFQVAIDVPGIEPDNVEVTIDKDENLLTVSGKRESTSEGYSFSSQFSQSFYLDPSVDTEQFTASLKGGVLVVKAPKDLKQEENENIRKIPVMSHEEEKKEDLAAAMEEVEKEAKEDSTATKDEVEKETKEI